MEQELYEKYKQLGKGRWGRDMTIWKALYQGFLSQAKEQEFNPFSEMMLKIFLDVPNARKEEIPIVMHPFNYEPTLIFAMNLTPMMQEIISVGLSFVHMNEPYIDFANQSGYGDNPTLCNAQRPHISLTLQGGAPNPDFLIYLSTPCNSLSMSYQVYQHLTKIPSFIIDIPYWAYEQEDEYYDEKTVEYMINQKKNLITWLEEKTQHKFEVESFQHSMGLLNEARENILEFNELLKTVPCPMPSMTGFANFYAMVTRGGHEDAVITTKYFRDIAAENVKNGIGAVPDEKLRICWPYTHIFFDQELLPWIEETHNAIVIMDLLGHYKVPPRDVSTLEKCYETIAKGALDASMVGKCRGPMEYYVKYLVDYVKDYKIDAVIMPMHMACKHVYTMGRVASEVIREETGVPSLIFGCDSYDSREVTSEEIKAKITEFITQVVL